MQVIESANEIKDRATDWFDALSEHFEARWNLGVLNASEKVALSVSNIFSSLIIVIFGGIMILFVSISAAIFIGYKLSNLPLGFMIVGFLYGLIGIILFIIKEKFLKRNFTNKFIQNFYYEKPD